MGENTIMETSKKVAIYCRLSEEDRNKENKEDDSNSIKNQKALLTEICLKNDWEIYNIYSDDNYSGGNANRPAFQKLIQDAKNRKFNIVLCKSQSRFARDATIDGTYIDGLFSQLNIRFIALNDKIDTADKGNMKYRQINALMNEWYIADLSNSIKSVLGKQQRDGKHIGAFALYGYQKDPNQKGHLIIDEEAAAIVREVFTLFAQGYGKTTIARMLNERGVPNPTEYKRQKGLRYQPPKTKQSTLWKYFAISDMLVNEMYIGNMVQGKYGSISYKTKQNKPRPKEEWIRVEGTHEPIIDRELWDKVQNLIQQRAKPFSTGQIGLFARKVRCKHCGYIMRSSKNHGYYYLRCSSRHVAKDSCIGSFISVRDLEEVIIEKINKKIQSYITKDDIEKGVEKDLDYKERMEKLKKEIKNIENDLKQNTKSLADSFTAQSKGDINMETFKILNQSFLEQKENLENRKQELNKKIEKLQYDMNTKNSIEKFIEQCTKIEHLDREIIDKLIDHIEVWKKNPITDELKVDVYWNF